MLILLIVILIILLQFSFFIFDRDILAPGTVVPLVFLFGSCCTLSNAKIWGLNFSGQTTGLVAAGVGAFIIGGVIGVFLSNMLKGKLYFRFIHERSEVTPIYIGTGKTVLIIFFQIVTLVMLFKHVRQASGYSNWILAVTKYRILSISFPPDPSVEMSFLLSNMVEACFAIGMIYSYIVGNNLVSHKKQQMLNWIPILLSVMMTFMQGDRSNMIRLWLVILITAYTLHKRSMAWKSRKETRKIMRGIVISVIAVGAIFSVFRGIVGRGTDGDPLYHLTFYAGCPLAAFDQFLKHPIPPSNIWGKETFYYTNVSFNVLFGRPERYNFYKDFIQSPNGTWVGNVYTALRPPYYDFGFWGMLLIMFIMGAFFTYLYCKIRKKKGTNPIDFRLLLYDYIAYTFFLYFYNCYNAFISHTFIELCVELLILRWFLVKCHFKFRAVNFRRAMLNERIMKKEILSGERGKKVS